MLFANPASRNGLDATREPLPTNPAGEDESGNLVILGNRVIQKLRISTCSAPKDKVHEQCESGHVFWDRLDLKTTLPKKLNKLIRHMSEWINSGRAGWGLLGLLAGLAVFPLSPRQRRGRACLPSASACRSVVGAREGSVGSLGV